MIKKLAGKFSKIGENENSLFVGIIFNSDVLEYIDILDIAAFYNLKNSERFGYHFITKTGAEKISKLPVNNYKSFIEFFK